MTGVLQQSLFTNPLALVQNSKSTQALTAKLRQFGPSLWVPRILPSGQEHNMETLDELDEERGEERVFCFPPLVA